MHFALDTINYEIDLSAVTDARLRENLARFLNAATEVKVQVSDRGRIAATRKRSPPPTAHNARQRSSRGDTRPTHRQSWQSGSVCLREKVESSSRGYLLQQSVNPDLGRCRRWTRPLSEPVSTRGPGSSFDPWTLASIERMLDVGCGGGLCCPGGRTRLVPPGQSWGSMSSEVLSHVRLLRRSWVSTKRPPPVVHPVVVPAISVHSVTDATAPVYRLHARVTPTR